MAAVNVPRLVAGTKFQDPTCHASLHDLSCSRIESRTWNGGWKLNFSYVGMRPHGDFQQQLSPLSGDTWRVQSVRTLESGYKFRMRVFAAGFGGAKGNGGGNKGFGNKTGGKQEPDPASLLRKSMKSYDKMVDAGGFCEYVISVRKVGEGNAAWLPVAQLLVNTEELSSEVIRAGLSVCSREISECRERSKKKFAQKSASQEYEFAYEPMDAFCKRDIVSDFYEREAGSVGGEKKKTKVVTECAYGVLGLPKGTSSAEVRTAYRSLAAAHHPDRHVGGDQDKAEVEFKRIGDAYERIKSLGGDPNNALLGGATKADSNMSEPFQLPKATEVESHCLPPNTKFAVYPVQDELASLFYGTYMRRKMPATA